MTDGKLDDFLETRGDARLELMGPPYSPPYSDVDLGTPNPWGIPDWRQPQEYEWMKNLDYFQWRWEFIRRNNIYRNAWLSMQRDRAEKNDWHVIFDLEDEVIPYFNVRPAGPQFDCRMPDIADWLGDYLDDDLFFEDTDGASEEYLHGWLLAAMERKKIVACLDPRAPVGPQLERLKRLMEAGDPFEDQPKAVRSRERQSKYPLYVRLLDARDQLSPFRASFSEIVRVLEHENHCFSVTEDSIKRGIRQARRVQKNLVAATPHETQVG